MSTPETQATAPIIAALPEAAAKLLDAFVNQVKDHVDQLAPAEAPTAEEPAVWDINLVYGELTPRGMHQVISSCVAACKVLTPPSTTSDAISSPNGSKRGRPPPRAFWDLGSGEGVPVFVAAMGFDCFERCVGVELLPKLDTLARRHLTAARRILTESGVLPADAQPVPLSPWACTGSDDGQALAKRLETVELVMGDFLEADWSAAAIVFCNGTCYQDDVLKPLFKKAEGLRPGAIFCITSQTVTSPLFELVWEAVVPSSWGTATARAYRRKELPRWLSSIRTGGASSR